MSKERPEIDQIVGRWRRLTSTSAALLYPKYLEFTEAGFIDGKNDGASNTHPVWDSGCFQIIQPNEIQMTCANDAIAKYQISISESELVFFVSDSLSLIYCRDA
jgi:hypothetical protein